MQAASLSYDDALQHAQQLLFTAQHLKAVQLSRHLLQQRPHDPIPYYILGLALTQQNEYQVAREALELALRLAPQQAELWLALGKTYDAERDFAHAQQRYQQGLQHAPHHLPLLYAAARNLEAQQQEQSALALYRRMTELSATDLPAREGLWRCLRNLQLRDELLQPEKAAQAETPILRIIRAKTLIELGTDSSLSEAEELLQVTLASEPDRADALAALSLLYRVRGAFDHCLPIAQRLVAIQPDRTEGYLGCIESLIAEDRDADAWAVGKQAAARSGSHAMLLHAAAFIAQIPLSNDHIQRQRKRVRDGIQKLLAAGVKSNNPLREAPLTYFYFAYHGSNNKQLLSFIADSLRKLAPPLSYEAKHVRQARNSGPLRIAFVSTFMRDHPVGRCYQPLLGSLAQQPDMAIRVYTRLKDADPIQQTMREQQISVEALPMELSEARAAIEHFEPDVLLYGDIGMDNFTYYLAFSRLAKLQCLLPGHPETSGIDTIDYLITQKDLEGSKPESRYRERPLLLNDFAMAYPTAQYVADTRSRSELELPSERFYLIPARLQKIHPDFDKLVAEILRKDTEAVALYFDDLTATGWSHSLKTRMQRQYPDVMPRVRFRRWANKTDFPAILSHAEVILDPIHFGLGTTAIYAFAQGRSIVTRPYDNMASRPVYAMLKRMGIAETIAESDEAYVRIAIELAHDSERRKRMDEQVRAGFPRLFKVSQAVDELTAFFRQKLPNLIRAP